MATKEDLFEDIARQMEYWSNVVAKALTEPTADLQWVEDEAPYREVQRILADSAVSQETVAKVLSDGLRGFAHSILVALDGGTALSEKGRIYVVDEHGTKIGEGLHEGFVGHLLDSGRLPC